MQFNRNPLYQSVRFALGTGAIAGLALSGQAFAQDDDAAELERIETTGSRLSQVDIEGASPVTSIDREDIERIGLTDLADVIRQLPSIGGSPLSTSTNNGGSGATLVDIRGLGSVRTLVLINGKRDITGGDFSNIPIALVERIDVLKEGAAAIYGADAVAGVINIITRRDFEGAELQAQYGASFELDDNIASATNLNPAFTGTDGTVKRVAFTFGGNTERGNFVAGIEFNEQSPVYQGQIGGDIGPQFQNVINVADQAGFINDGFPGCLSTGSCNANGGSSASLGGFFNPVDDPNAGAFTRDLQTGEIRPFNAAGGDLYNFAPVNFIQTPFERTSVFFQGDYELFDGLEAYVEARYNNRQSEQELAPNPLFLIQNIFDPTVPLDNDPALPLAGQFGIPSNNAFNPFGLPVTDLRRRVAESRRRFEQEENIIQINSGLRGDFGDFAPTWSWDVSWNWGREREANTDFGQLVGANFLQAIGPSFFDENGVATCGTPGAAIAGCVPLNLFGGFGSITQEQLDFIEFELNDSIETQLQVFNATIKGDVFELPAGPLSTAFGYEFRKQELDAIPDSGKATNSVTGNVFGRTTGEFDVDSLFIEVNIPLLSGVPGAELLEIGGGFRYDDYSTIGDTGNFQGSLRWQPFRGFLVRGSFAEVFREPTIGNLFSPQGDSFPSFLDICRSSASVASNPTNSFAALSAAEQARCVQTGAIVTGMDANGQPFTFDQTNAQPRSRVGGNPNVGPESGETYTVGIAFSPDFLPGFSFTADYWDVSLDNAIAGGGIAAQTVIALCVQGGQDAFCNDITRQSFGNVGEVAQIESLATNIGGESASGIDFGFNYNFNTGFGLFDARLLVTWLDERTSFVFGDSLASQGLPDDTINVSGQFDDRNGLTEAIYPEWKGLFTLDWSLGDFGASVNVEYLDSVTEDLNQGIGQAPGGPINNIPAEWYVDLTARYNFAWGTEISGGITNIFDSDPPFITRGFNANTDVDTYRLLGRSWFARVTHRF